MLRDCQSVLSNSVDNTRPSTRDHTISQRTAGDGLQEPDRSVLRSTVSLVTRSPGKLPGLGPVGQRQSRATQMCSRTATAGSR